MSESKSAAWIDRVDRVLAREKLDEQARRAVIDGLRAAPDALRAQLFVEGRTPVDGGIIAPTDAKLVTNARGFGLYFDGSEYPIYEYRVDPSKLLVADGARVVAGQVLKAGDVFAEAWIETFGDEGRPKVLEAACEQTGLSRELASLLIAPMLDGVRIRRSISNPDDNVESEGSRLRRWNDRTLMTASRFSRELIAAYEFAFDRAGLGDDPRVVQWKQRSVEDRAASALPYEWFGEESRALLEEIPVGQRALLDYRALSRMDDEGLVLDHEPSDAGRFEITSGTISVSDSVVVERRPARGLFEAKQLSFGAVRGRWKVLATRHHDGRVDLVRLWHERARPWLRAPLCARVEYVGATLLVCDLSKPNVDRARSKEFAEQRAALMRASNVAVLDGLGVLIEGRARKRFATVRVQRGFEDRVEAMEIAF